MMDTGTPWATTGRPPYPLENMMGLRTSNPATKTAAADDTEVRTAEQPGDGAAEVEQEPERDSHDDLVRRVANLERHIL